MTLTSDAYRVLSALVLEKTSEGLLCLNPTGEIIFANDAGAHTLGYAPTALCDTDIFHIAPEMVPALWKEFWKELKANGTFAFEFQLNAADGRTLQVDMVAHRVDISGQDMAAMFFHDIEERKRLQNLQQEFVSNVSHELRTPMTVIREGISQVVEGLRGDINTAQKRALTLALSGIERMGRIINDLLDISKIESGKISLRRERVDFNAIAREAAGTFQAHADDRQIDLQLSTPAGELMVYGDRDRLVQVLTNLIGNSFKYTEKGHITVQVKNQDGDVVCTVSDSGIGIESADKEKIFSKFEQGQHAALTGEKGTGLGLSISRGIIELHRGRIWAESAGRDKGASISFSLPRQKGLDVFRDQLAVSLHKVARRGGNLTAILFRLAPERGITVDAMKWTPLLETLEQLVRRQSGRMSDLLVVDENALYVAFESTVKREGMRLADLILEAARRDMAHALTEIALTYRLISFPEDIPTEREFLETLSKENR